MKRAAAIALCILGIAIPVCAQRGGHAGAAHGAMAGGHSGFAGASRGSFSNRPAFSGSPARSFTAPRFSGPGRVAPGRFAGPSRFASAAPRGMAPRYRSAPAFTPTVRNMARPEYNRGYRGNRDSRDHRRRYRPSYTSAFGYGIYPGLGWYDPYLFDYADDNGYGDSDSATYPYDQNAVNGGYDSQPPDQGQYEQGQYDQGQYAQGPYQGPPIPYRSQPPTPAPSSAPSSESGESVTLVFKDGRPSEQIHNYILSRTTLSVLDQHRQDIPVSDLDLTAMQKANREAGVNFSLPR